MPRQNGDTETTFVEIMPPLAATPIYSVASLTPHLYAPDALRPLRAKEHFLKADTFVELHSHPWPQLTFSTRGVIRLSTEDGSYIVPPSRALWVPADMPHSVTLIEDAELRTVYVHSWMAPSLAKCEVLEISPLLRALMLALVITAAGQPLVHPHCAPPDRW